MRNFTQRIKLVLVLALSLVGLSAQAIDQITLGELTYTVKGTQEVQFSTLEHTAYSGETIDWSAALTAAKATLGLDAVTAEDLLRVDAEGAAFPFYTNDGWASNDGMVDGCGWGTELGVCVKAWNVSETEERVVDGVVSYFGCYDESHSAGDESHAYYALVKGADAVVIDFHITYTEKKVTTYLLSNLSVVAEYSETLHFSQGGQYENKTLEMDAAALADMLGTDMATLEDGFAGRVLTQTVYHDGDSGEDLITDTLGVVVDMFDGWFGRYADNTSENVEAMLLQNAPKGWGAGCTYYLHAPALADGKFTLVYGQFPGTLQHGDKDYADVYIVYGEKAAKITLTVDVEPLADVPFSEMEQVSQIDITLSQSPTNDYSTSQFSIDVAAAAELLGVESASDVTLYPLKDDTSLYTGASTANNGGWWFNKAGFVCGWASGADGSYFFIEPAATGDYSAMNMGQMPDQCQVGDQVGTDLLLVYGTKYVRYHVVLDIVEKPIVDDNEWEIVANRTVVVKQVANDGYVWSEQAGIIKSIDLTNLIETTAPVLYGEAIDEEGAVTKTDAYTMGEKPGFWMTSEGYATGWNNNSTWGMTSQVGTTGATGGDWGFKCMQFPGSGVLGNSFQGTFYLVNLENNKCIKVTLVSQVVENVEEQEVIGEEDVVLPVTLSGESIDFPLDRIAEKFGITADELYAGNYLHGVTGGAVAASNGLQFTENGSVDESNEGAFGLMWESEESLFVYSNMAEEVADDWSTVADVIFEVESKQYILHCRFVSMKAYQEYLLGINTIKGDKLNNAIFDLSGRQVEKAQKGIFIQNGKKVVK